MQIVSAKYHSVDIDSGLPNRLSAYDENGQRYGIDPNDQLAMQRFGVKAAIEKRRSDVKAKYPKPE